MRPQANITTNQTAISVLIGNRFRLARHTVLLVAFLIFLYSAIDTRFDEGPFKYGKLLYIYFGFLAMFYINMYLLVPLFFFKGKYLFYFSLLALTVYLVLMILSYILDHYISENQPFPEQRLGLYIGGMICIAIIMVTTAFKLFARWITDREKMAEINNLALNMELDALRNQINPHFLFNMLNNVKALIRIDPEKASNVIMKLSEFLRYQLYENRGETAALRSELDFLFNLVELEKIRRDNLMISVSADLRPEQISEINLPTNLFTNFVENAIKYSVDVSGKQEEIKIFLSIEGKFLRFTCTNTKGQDIWSNEDLIGGLGLSNIRRQLALLFPGNHFLEITSLATAYTIDLKIPI